MRHSNRAQRLAPQLTRLWPQRPALLVLAAALALVPATLASASAAPPISLSDVSSSAALLSDQPGWHSPLGGSAPPNVLQEDVLEEFDPPDTAYGAGHRGVDLAAPAGSAVVAPAAGRVAFVGVVVDRPVISIDHPNGLRTSFEPLTATVAVGDAVEAGDLIGQTAAGGHCAQRCVHWGLRLHGEYIDPLLTIRDTRPSVLLPLG